MFTSLKVFFLSVGYNKIFLIFSCSCTSIHNSVCWPTESCHVIHTWWKCAWVQSLICVTLISRMHTFTAVEETWLLVFMGQCQTQLFLVLVKKIRPQPQPWKPIKSLKHCSPRPLIETSYQLPNIKSKVLVHWRF